MRSINILKKIYYIILIVLGTAGIAATVVSLFVSAAITIGTIMPGAAGIVIGTYGLIHVLRPGHIIRKKTLRMIITVVVCIGIAVFAVIEGVIIYWANTDTSFQDADYVIVLGCGVFPDGRLSLTLKNRLDTAYGYLVRHEDTLCIVSGGQGTNEPLPEAEAMKAYLIGLGLNESRIRVETTSTSTKENIAHSVAIMQQVDPDMRHAGIVTSDFHVFRSVIIAKSEGLNAFGIAAPTPWYISVNCYMRECIGVIHSVLFELD